MRKARMLITWSLTLCLCTALGLFAPRQAYADQAITKVLATTSQSPVATIDVNSILANTSTGGCYVSYYNWVDKAGNILTGSFGTENYQVEITISTYDGYYFAENVIAYLNNSPVMCSLSSDLRALTLWREYAPDVWVPTIVKNPGSETVDAGGFASFVASAMYADKFTWYFSDASGGGNYSADELMNRFPAVKLSDNGEGRMNLHEIPAEMDGWKLRCLFSGPGGDVYSDYATINVKHEATPPPSPTPTATPSPKPSAAASSSPKPSASPSPSPGAQEEHTHVFGEKWVYDEFTHWKECQCGEETQQGTHSMVWETVTKATRDTPGSEVGECSVCGYRTNRSVAFDSGSNMAKYIVWGVGILIVLIVVALIISGISSSRRRRRRRRRRR